MTNYPRCILKPGKEMPVKRHHPWIFSGAVREYKGVVREGDFVEIYSSTGEYLATGYFLGGSIAVKIFSFQQQEITRDFWKQKLHQAFDLRKSAGLTDGRVSTAYRLVHSEGDGFPGLIIDFYNGTAVFQAHSVAMHNLRNVFVEALQDIYGNDLKAVYDKSSETLKNQVTDKKYVSEDKYLFGKKGVTQITETGHKFNVHWEQGQKTGFFLDQRLNRMLAQFYSSGRKVLNAFCYTGAFSVYALKGGAASVTSVDSSKQAVEWTNENIRLNEINESLHKGVVDDAKRFLSGTDEKYDMIILDPPAFAKHHNVTHNALQAYIHINAEALNKLNPGGILFTFSCSQAISREMFQSAVHSAAIEAARDAKILHRLSQGTDHPVSIFHPEAEYLKGLVLLVNS